MEQKLKNEFEYAQKLLKHITIIFSEPENPNYIDLSTLDNQDKITQFMHAVGNIVPASVFNSVFGEEKDLLAVNQICTQLCFEFAIQDFKEGMEKENSSIVDVITEEETISQPPVNEENNGK